MKLSGLLEGISDFKAENFSDMEIAGVTDDSRAVGKGFLFVCFAGGRADGHDFYADALKAGAAAVIAERRLPLPETVPQITVADARAAFGTVLGNFYGNPVRKMKLVCFTGTNGKTTSSYILKSILAAAKIKCGLIGTTAYFVGDKRRAASLTTPDPALLHELFYEMYNAGCKVVVMELSAHAIKLNKLSGVTADITVLTNITRDHLDYFGTEEEYKNAKLSWFTPEHTRLAIVNIDDPAGEYLYRTARVPTAAYGLDNPAGVFAVDVKNNIGGISYLLNSFDNLAGVRFALPGRYNVYNTLAAAAAAHYLGIDVKTVSKGIAALPRVDGRFEVIESGKGVTFIVDYAHTPDGVENVLKALSEIKRKRLIAVFGCGGDRDKGKRPLMGAAAARYCDFLVVTSDNPRGEEVEAIISDIIYGIPVNTKYITEPDRKTAIEKAYAEARAGDIVAVLGKGAEEYQESKGVKEPFSDRKIIGEL